MTDLKYEEVSSDCRLYNGETFSIIEWDGEISEDNISDFSDILTEGVETKNNIIFEFSKVNFCISKAIGVMAVSIKKLKVKNGKLFFVNPTERVLAVLKITKLIDMVVVCETIDEALKHV